MTQEGARFVADLFAVKAGRESFVERLVAAQNPRERQAILTERALPVLRLMTDEEVDTISAVLYSLRYGVN